MINNPFELDPELVPFISDDPPNIDLSSSLLSTAAAAAMLASPISSNSTSSASLPAPSSIDRANKPSDFSSLSVAANGGTDSGHEEGDGPALAAVQAAFSAAAVPLTFGQELLPSQLQDRFPSPDSPREDGAVSSIGRNFFTQNKPLQVEATVNGVEEALKNALDQVERGNMISSFEILAGLTETVASKCEELGLATDDCPPNFDRDGFWNGLNNTWLYAISRCHLSCSDSERLSHAELSQIREAVIRWADTLEKYGLVDYEMGWWEQDILEALDAQMSVSVAVTRAVSTLSTLPALPAMGEQQDLAASLAASREIEAMAENGGCGNPEGITDVLPNELEEMTFGDESTTESEVGGVL
ncbi:uncharacterized protein VTP21DRAFT_6581 [Calcarisporiella thermophila]|uniref:uncharacterized protein n=1 Tax=Calcarisporiella thermophila TaxID=911321 RepID=UPI003741F7B8